MHKNEQVSFEKMQKKITSRMKEAHQEFDQVTKTWAYEGL